MSSPIESSAFSLTEEQLAIREAIDDLCEPFDNEYWRKLTPTREYPEEFVDALYEAGWMSMLIPEEFGGGGADIRDAAVVLEQLERNGCHAGAARAGMYTMGALLRHGSEEQKQRFLPKIASGELRLQSFGVTEPDAGSDTTRIRTFAEREGDEYVVNGSKIFISRVQHSDLLLLLTRTHEARGRRRSPPTASPCCWSTSARPSRTAPSWPPRSDDGQPRDQRARHREPARAGGEPHRRGGQGLQGHPLRHELRARHRDLGVHRRRLLPARPRGAVRQRARGLRPPDRAEPGRPVPASPRPTPTCRPPR